MSYEELGLLKENPDGTAKAEGLAVVKTAAVVNPDGDAPKAAAKQVAADPKAAAQSQSQPTANPDGTPAAADTKPVAKAETEAAFSIRPCSASSSRTVTHHPVTLHENLRH